MNRWLKYILVLLVIPGTVAGLLIHLDRHSFFDLDRIEIVLQDAPERTLYLKPLVEQLDRSLEAYRGKSLWMLDLDLISSKIDGLNWVEGHSIARRWPSTLTVKIRPYEVKALFVAKRDKLVPVIREGRLLDPVEPALAPDVALLEGVAFKQRADLRRKAIDMLDEIPPDGTFSRKTVSEVHWDTKEGFHLTMTKTGVDVKMGEDLFAIKAARIGQVLDYLGDRGIRARGLDANLSKKVVVRMANSAEAHIE